MVDFKIKNVIIDNELIKLYIWDTAGQERYRALVSNYFKGTQGILLIFDLGNPASFESIQNSWYQIGKEKSGDASFILVGNKSDLKVRKVDPVKIEQFSKAHNLPYFEVSAFTGSNINEAFNCIATDIKVRVIKKDPTKSEEDSQINERENTQVTKIDAKKQSIILKSSPKQTDPKQKKKDCSC